MAANVLLVAFYALELGRGPLGPVSLGSLNDLVGSVSTTLMVPVALAFGPRWVRLLGLVAMAVFTVAGPLLVFGVLLPWQSWPQLLLFGIGGVLGTLGWLAMPVWFVVLGRALRTTSDPVPAAR